jgi:hypothetical protein
MSTRSRNRLFAVTVLAFVALTAVVAQTASAATWTTGSTFTNGQTETLKTAAPLMGTMVYTWTISGLAVELTAEKLEIIEGKIKQNGTTAEFTGKAKFSGLKLDKPAGCSPPASITTAALTGSVFQAGSPAKTYIKVQPASGTTFATITTTGTCAIAGTAFKVTTSSYFCGETNSLGTMAVLQRVTVSPTVLTACGGNLSTGGNPATLTGEATVEVSSGVSWGAV